MPDRSNDDLFEETPATFFKFAPFHRTRFLSERATDEAIATPTLQPQPGGTTKVETRVTVENLTIRTALPKWFDDSYGRELGGIAKLATAKEKWSVQSGHFPQNASAA